MGFAMKKILFFSFLLLSVFTAFASEECTKTCIIYNGEYYHAHYVQPTVMYFSNSRCSHNYIYYEIIIWRNGVNNPWNIIGTNSRACNADHTSTSVTNLNIPVSLIACSECHPVCSSCGDCIKCGYKDHSSVTCPICNVIYKACGSPHACSTAVCPEKPDCSPCSSCGSCKTHDGKSHESITCNDCKVTYSACSETHTCLECPNKPDCSRCNFCYTCSTHDGKKHSETCSKCNASYHPCIETHTCLECPNKPDCSVCPTCRGCTTHDGKSHESITCPDCSTVYKACETGHSCILDCPNKPDCSKCSACGGCSEHDGKNHGSLTCTNCKVIYTSCSSHNCLPVPPDDCPNNSDCRKCSACGGCSKHDGKNHSSLTCPDCKTIYSACKGHICGSPDVCPNKPDCSKCSACGGCSKHDGKNHGSVTCPDCKTIYTACKVHSCEVPPDEDYEDTEELILDIKIPALEEIKRKLLPNISNINIGSDLPVFGYYLTFQNYGFELYYNCNVGIFKEIIIDKIGYFIKILSKILMTIIFVFACIRIVKK